MGTITRTFTNNIGASGVLGSGAINNASLNSITSISGVSLKLLSTATASADASVSITSGLDSTYDEYWFIFNNIHPATNNTIFGFQASTDGGSNYNTTITSSHFISEHAEDGSADNVYYWTNGDLAQGTGYQRLTAGIGNGNDEQYSGILKLYNPSSTTFVKHFHSFGNAYYGAGIYSDQVAGYFNTTSAINAIDFKMESGNIDAGTIKLYGVN